MNESTSTALAPKSEIETTFALAQREAKALVDSGLLPEPLRNVGAAMQVMAMARETGLPAFMLAQSLYAVKGKIGLSSSYMIALANKHPRIEQNLRWSVADKWPGALEVTCHGRLKGDPEGSERTVTLSMADAKDMGWTGNEKYRSRASATHMLKFRTATWWVRENVPEVLLGLATSDELADTPEPLSVDVRPAPASLPEPRQISAPAPVDDIDPEEEAHAMSAREKLEIRADEAGMSLAAYLGSLGWAKSPDALTDADAERLLMPRAK